MRLVTFLFINFGAVAQLEERHNGIVEVVGSIPIGSRISLRRGLTLRYAVVPRFPILPLFRNRANLRISQFLLHE